MARPVHAPTYATTLVPAALRWAGQACAEDEVLLPLDRIEACLEELAFGRGEPALGLSLPERLVFPRSSYAEVAAQASDDVDAALGRIARYAGLSVPGATGERRGSGLSLRFPPRAQRPSRVLHEWGLAQALHTLRVAAGTRLRPRRVWFVHARPRDLGPVHLFFGTDQLEFGRVDDGFDLAEEDLRRPLARADRRLAATMDALAEGLVAAVPRSYAERVSIAIVLPDTSLDGAARRLHASPRTVQRWLEAEGTQFSEVLDRVRADAARALLADPGLSMAEIAARVGFSDVAPFTRAFRRWTGTPPGTFRRTRR